METDQQPESRENHVNYTSRLYTAITQLKINGAKSDPRPLRAGLLQGGIILVCFAVNQACRQHVIRSTGEVTENSDQEAIGSTEKTREVLQEMEG